MFTKKMLLAVLLTMLGSSQAKVTLRHLSTEYLPIAYNGSSETFAYSKDAAEQLAYDPTNNYIYVVGVDLIHVLDFSDPSNIRRVDNFQFPAEGDATDVEACGDFVAVSFDDSQYPLAGKVYVFRTYNGSKLELLQVIVVGAEPDMVKFTHNCDRLLVAVEGELKMVHGQVTDPEGQVGIITFLNADADYSLQSLNFKAFNDVADQYIAKGVRWVWRGENSDITTTFSQDLEPEYISINDDDTIAYVVLQENNAIATIDLTVPAIIDIYPLGQKYWQPDTMDPSDKDGGIELGSWDIYGMYQPDGFKLVTINGVQYLLTADEGDTKEYKEDDYGFDWSEAVRGKHFDSGDLIDDSVSSEMVDFLEGESELGRLDLSIVDGIVPETGKINTFYSFGGRSFSLYDATDFSQIYTSQDLLEVQIASQYPTVFNSNPKNDDETPAEAIDTRSDNRGPEPEAVDYAELEFSDGELKRLIFVGIERPGFIGIFSVTDDFPGEGGISVESFHYNGGYGDTYEELWKDRVARDLDPEDLKVLPASRSPIGEPLLAVAGANSGTLSLYAIYDDDDDDDDIPGQDGQGGDDPKDSGGLATGAIIGIVAACVCIVAVVVSVSLYFIKRKRSHVQVPTTYNVELAT